ncbi:MAG: penicillin acylase family protein, partial [Armatimonadetes bacterium]|nr:penicillin acylase family protein [Armatimonadota bacterium]
DVCYDNFMILAVFSALTTLQSGSICPRDAFGVPQIKAGTVAAAFRIMGHAVAEDRLWQMELSRRTFRGQLAEILGASAAPSDREILRLGYTDSELQAQVRSMAPEARDAFSAYAEGVNDAIAAMRTDKNLPAGYSQYQFDPKPWTTIDSAAICVGMAKRFGGGGAGEIRNLLAYQYLLGTPAKDRVLDVVDDLLWQNEPRAITTLQPEDDKLGKPKDIFPVLTRDITKKHLAMLPNPGLFELIPGIRLADMEDNRAIAMSQNVLYKTGSYCIVVDKSRSKSGANLLLSGPQMGHSAPSIAHEVVIDTPDLKVTGISVPGIPAVLVGNTPNFAWGLTTSVADTTDIFFNKYEGDSYIVDGKTIAFKNESRTLRVRDGKEETVNRISTQFGPVVVQSGSTKTAFSMKAAYSGRELSSFAELFTLYRSKTGKEILKEAERLPVGFNLFFATKADIGYAYCGLTPLRSTEMDPRFPIPGSTQFDWKGVVPTARLVKGLNPKYGLFVNWNNKPVDWWPNLDTPAWGELFRNELILKALPAGKIGRDDLVATIREIAKNDDQTLGAFSLPFAAELADNPAAAELRQRLVDFDGRLSDGSVPAATYNILVDELRTAIFQPQIGNFIQPDLFKLAVQPSVMLRAWEGKTHFPFVNLQNREEIIQKVTANTLAKMGAAAYRAGRIRYEGQPVSPVYSNRGTFIQIVQMESQPRAESILGPGEAATGPHSGDQAQMVQDWRFKPMVRW